MAACNKLEENQTKESLQLASAQIWFVRGVRGFTDSLVSKIEIDEVHNKIIALHICGETKVQYFEIDKIMFIEQVFPKDKWVRK